MVIALVGLLIPLPVTAARLGTATSPGIPWLRVALVFLLCIALAIAAVLTLRRHQGRQDWAILTRRFSTMAQVPRRQITVIETRRVSQHGDVCLIHCHGRAYLLAMGQGHATLLDQHSLAPEGDLTEGAA